MGASRAPRLFVFVYSNEFSKKQYKFNTLTKGLSPKTLDFAFRISEVHQLDSVGR